MDSDMDRWTAALDRVLTLAVLVNDDMTRSLARDGLTTSRTHLLWELRSRGPTTQRDLAEALKVSPRTVTGLVDGLVATGFVTRQPHPTDRRAIHVTFTELGAEVMEKMGNDHRRFAAGLFAGMAPERLSSFVDGMDEVLARLHALGVSHDVGAEDT